MRIASGTSVSHAGRMDYRAGLTLLGRLAMALGIIALLTVLGSD
jgi:hypothetical protein